MAYHVKKIFGNGYRCTCCSHKWESTDWFEDRALALAEVPRTAYRSDNGGDIELLAIEVTDGETGEIVAVGDLIWCGGRGSRYSSQRWAGFIDEESFEEILGAQPGETWNQLVVREKRAVQEKKLRAVEEKIKEAEKEAQWLRSQLEKLPTPNDI